MKKLFSSLSQYPHSGQDRVNFCSSREDCSILPYVIAGVGEGESVPERRASFQLSKHGAGSELEGVVG